MTGDLDADVIVRLLGLEPHPEGGMFREVFRDPQTTGGRACSTAIYYLLRRGERSAWHRVSDAAEVWHFYAGAAMRLELSADGTTSQSHHVGLDLAAGERPQIVVPVNCWQSAESLGDWTLAGCTVAPGFEFRSFEMAPAGWRPG